MQRGPVQRDVGGLRLLRKSDFRASRSRRVTRRVRSGGGRGGPHPAFRCSAGLGGVPRPGGSAGTRWDGIPHPALHSLRRAARRANHDVLSRPQRELPRAQGVPESRRGIRPMRADVVVIGAGVVGCSVAYHLAKAGNWRITVVDRGGGSTENATGGFRAQFATAVNVQLSLLSLRKLLCFAEETGVEPGYRPCGYLFVASTPWQVQRLREALAVQR